MATINAVGNGLTAATGTGNFVGSNSPTLITPALGTPSSGNLINCTGYPGVILTAIAASSTPITSALNAIYYITDASTVTINLPGTAAAGSIVGIVGTGAGGWILAPAGGQAIKMSGVSASTSIASAAAYDCIQIMCTVANTTWVVMAAITTGFTYS